MTSTFAQAVRVSYPWEKVDEADPSSTIVAPTGIPPHVHTAVMLQKVWRSMEEMPAVIRDMVKAMLDDRNIGGGDLSIARLREEITGPFVSLMEKHFGALPTRRLGEEVDTRLTAGSFPWKDGRSRLLPECYEFCSKMGVLAAWQIWHHGERYTATADASEVETDGSESIGSPTVCKIGPLRNIQASDVTVKQKRKFHLFKKLCGLLDATAGISDSSLPPSQAALADMYNGEAISKLLPAKTTPRGRVRRRNELSWVYSARTMPSSKKQKVST